ncbi:hypothetical protein DOY81_000042 [Sarcophaga bullata]|nr:hypothetical protein DOY81_000042 [Sarcophaga bullata]
MKTILKNNSWPLRRLWRHHYDGVEAAGAGAGADVIVGAFLRTLKEFLSNETKRIFYPAVEKSFETTHIATKMK